MTFLYDDVFIMNCYCSVNMIVIWTLSLILVFSNMLFWKLNLFPSSGDGGGGPTLLDPLERINLDPCVIIIVLVTMCA